MKIFRKAGILAIAMFMMFSFSSCGDDDDDNGGEGGGKVEVNGMSRSLNYAYYSIDDDELELGFSSVDLESYKPAAKVSVLSIDCKVPAGTTKPVTMTLLPNQYNCFVALDLPAEGSEYDGFQVEKSYRDSGEPLTITVDGNKITVNLQCQVGDDNKEYPLTFKYNGPISYFPDFD